MKFVTNNLHLLLNFTNLCTGGTTVSINYLKKWGLIKPIPPKEKLKEIYKEKKENLKEKRDMFTEEIKIKKEQFKEKRANLMQRYRDGDQKS